MKKVLFIIIPVLLNFTCKEPQSQTTKPNVNTKVYSTQKNQQVVNTYKIIQVLQEVDKSAFPPVVNQYFEGNNNIKAKLIDKTTIRFYTFLGSFGNEVQIKLLRTDTKNYIFFISGIKKDSLRYQNYFYILQFQRNKPTNITLYTIPDQVIQILKLELETDFYYKKLANFWAYYSEISHYALYFDFFGNNCIVSRCFLNLKGESNYCKTFIKLTWQGDKFAFKIINPTPPSAGLLSDEQLDRVTRYTSFDQALINPEKVYILDLDGRGITQINPSIVMLKNLQILILSNNYLDSLPEFIGQLSHLQILRAENNNIKYVPKSLGNLIYLAEINLANNKISWIPYEFAKLKNLEKLNLSGNLLQILAFDMSHLNRLMSMDLSKNKFEKIPYQIFKLKSLVYLDLSNNPIKVLPKEFITMYNLQYLVIKNTLIDTSQIKYLKLKRKDLQIIY